MPGRHVSAARERLDIERLRVVSVDPVADAPQPGQVPQVLCGGRWMRLRREVEKVAYRATSTAVEVVLRQASRGWMGASPLPEAAIQARHKWTYRASALTYLELLREARNRRSGGTPGRMWDRAERLSLVSAGRAGIRRSGALGSQRLGAPGSRPRAIRWRSRASGYDWQPGSRIAPISRVGRRRAGSLRS